MKKNLRILNKFLVFIVIKLLNKLLINSNLKIIPPYDELEKFKFNYNENSRRLILENNKNKISKIYIDSSLYNSKLCLLGKKFHSNKSSLNNNGHRSGFTGLYSLLFFHLKNANINIAEIGIEKNASTKMWRNYFNKAEIHGFEVDFEKIKKAKRDKLKNTYYHYMNVNIEKSINEGFKKIKKKFDIIIDDSTHIFNDQIRIIKNSKKYLKSGGILVIEDIYRNRKEYEEYKYYDKIKKFKKEFREILFIENRNINNYTANWKNEKILFFVKK
jgi:SAM-dependent methyltransferase